MESYSLFKNKVPFVRWLLLGILILFIIAAPLHFIYDWTNQNMVAGLFAPVNESPWEHLKLVFWPILIWWTIGYLRFGKNQKNSFPRYIVSCIVAEIVCTLFIVAFFFTYTGALGIESLILDILSLFFGLLFGILLAIHVYNYSTPGTLAAFISTAIILIMVCAFLFFTFIPPHIPLFKDPPTGMYGI